MSKTQMIGSLPSKVLGLLADLMHKLQHGVITVRELELFLQRKDPFKILDTRSEWQEFYRKYFRIRVDFTNVQIPDDPGGFDRAIFIPKGLKIHDVIKVMRKAFGVWSFNYYELENEIVKNIRQSDRNYAIRLRELVEADEEIKNLLANPLKQQGVNCITLLERLVYELKYLSETGQHPDVQNFTLCAGSRDYRGRVPYVGWNADSGTLRIDLCDLTSADGNLRARQVVS